jgi:hypothetical protein
MDAPPPILDAEELRRQNIQLARSLQALLTAIIDADNQILALRSTVVGLAQELRTIRPDAAKRIMDGLVPQMSTERTADGLKQALDAYQSWTETAVGKDSGTT